MGWDFFDLLLWFVELVVVDEVVSFEAEDKVACCGGGTLDWDRSVADLVVEIGRAHV